MSKPTRTPLGRTVRDEKIAAALDLLVSQGYAVIKGEIFDKVIGDTFDRGVAAGRREQREIDSWL